MERYRQKKRYMKPFAPKEILFLSMVFFYKKYTSPLTYSNVQNLILITETRKI